MSKVWIRDLFVLFLLAFGAVGLRAGELEQAFDSPGESARPWVFWYWMYGAVSPEGIEADLDAMAGAGLGGAYLCTIKDTTDPPLYDPPVRTMTPRWWETLRHTMDEAEKRGLKIAMHACDGFATAGGPWITPGLAMQKVVWSETRIEGGRRYEGALAQPETNENYYRDIAVLAFPSLPGENVTSRTIRPKVTTSIPGVAPQGLAGEGETFRSEEPCWIQYAFNEPFTCRSIVIRPGGKNYQANRLTVEVSDDGRSFRRIVRLESPRHGWQDSAADCTHSIPPVTSRYFRFIYDHTEREPGAEDLDSAKWKERLKVHAIELSSAPRIHQYEGKSGAVWRKSPPATDAQLPGELCIPENAVINLTINIRADGTLAWDTPEGDWVVLRIGSTPTGSTNYIGGAAVGLECDKFNPEAARVQFEGWFGETLRRLGPGAAKTLTTFHIDSWEAGAQNWSPVFLEEFKTRRGYDPTPWMACFAGFPVGGADASERFLYDVRATIAELMNDNFFATMEKLAHERGLEFSAEATAPTMPGDAMAHYAHADLPMGEFWHDSPTHDKPTDMMDAISGAHIYGKNIVAAEAFTELHMRWDETPATLKALGDRNFSLGANRFTVHVMTQNPWLARKPGMTLGRTGLLFQRDQTWFPMAGAWMEYLTRCQSMLQEGRPVAQVAYFTGEELPRRALLPGRFAPPLPPGYKADSIHRDALMRLAQVSDGKIVLPGGATYEVLVLPGEKTMTPALAEKLMELSEAGATIIGAAPDCSPSLENHPQCDADVAKCVEALWGGGRITAAHSLNDVLREKGIAPDLIFDTYDAAATWTHRRTVDSEIYFIANPLAREIKFKANLKADPRRVELWDPLTGEKTSPVAICNENGRMSIPVELAASGSVFLIMNGNQTGTAPPPPTIPVPVMTLDGIWRIEFDPQLGGPQRPAIWAKLRDWTKSPNSGIRHYSGIAIYRTTFDGAGDAGPGARVWLDLGEVHDVAEVYLNGNPCGVAWTPPMRVEITEAFRSGKNELEIRVANTWRNRLIGDAGFASADRVTTTTAPLAFTPGDALTPAGLLGPVTVLSGLTKPE